VPIQRTFFSLRYLNCGSRHIQCNYSSAYSGFNIQLNVSLPLLEISRQFNLSNNANLVLITVHFLQLTLCGLWSRPYTMYLQLRIFRLQYSAVGICAAIGDISTIQWALHCKLGAKYSAHSPVCAANECNYSSAYSGFNIQLNASAVLLEIYRQFNARYTETFVPITAHILLFTPCELWYRSCTMHLQLRIFRLQYSSERICADIGGT
jgi:hypothetical protein